MVGNGVLTKYVIIKEKQFLSDGKNGGLAIRLFKVTDKCIYDL